jgi:hypothetical protein
MPWGYSAVFGQRAFISGIFILEHDWRSEQYTRDVRFNNCLDDPTFGQAGRYSSESTAGWQEILDS